MPSILTFRSDFPRFHHRWRGYDRAEVDAFLRQTAADRRRLQEDLAQLEAVMVGGHGGERRRELERLAALRTDVASCLEASIGALRRATDLLASATPGTLEPPPVVRQAKPASDSMGFRLKRPSLRRLIPTTGMPAGRTRALAGGLALTALMLVGLLYGSRSGTSATPTANVSTSPTAARPVVSPSPVVQQVEGLVLTLTARGSCWVRTIIDGGRPLERLLRPSETIMLRANDEAVLRVGDAAALSLLINNQVAKPLGAPGQVVTTQITRANYLDFLSEN
jgi:DivIVA domain-containing protein